MPDNTPFNRGFVAAFFLMLGGQAVHWFMTPLSHPDASALRAVAVAIQAAVGFGGGLWLLVRERSLRSKAA